MTEPEIKVVIESDETDKAWMGTVRQGEVPLLCVTAPSHLGVAEVISGFLSQRKTTQVVMPFGPPAVKAPSGPGGGDT